MSEIISKNKIRFLVFDEIHLAVHYGKTFRKEFGQLKVKLFDQIHLPANSNVVYDRYVHRIHCVVIRKSNWG
jgi:hypothetical protein